MDADTAQILALLCFASGAIAAAVSKQWALALVALGLALLMWPANQLGRWAGFVTEASRAWDQGGRRSPVLGRAVRPRGRRAGRPGQPPVPGTSQASPA